MRKTCLLYGSTWASISQYRDIQLIVRDISHLDAEHFERAIHARWCNERCVLSKTDASCQCRVIIEHLQLLPLLAHIQPAHTDTDTSIAHWLQIRWPCTSRWTQPWSTGSLPGSFGVLHNCQRMHRVNQTVVVPGTRNVATVIYLTTE